MAPMVSDRPDAPWPTVVVEYDRALGLCYSNLESVGESGRGTYWSVAEASGRRAHRRNTQVLLRIDVDQTATPPIHCAPDGRGLLSPRHPELLGSARWSPDSPRPRGSTQSAPRARTQATVRRPRSRQAPEEAQELIEANSTEDVVGGDCRPGVFLWSP